MIREFLVDQANRGAGHILYVSDLDQALRDLKRIDPQARKAFNKDTRNILLPYVNMARGFIPAESPLSKWRTTAPTYTSATWENDTKHHGRDANIRWVWDSADAKRGISITRGSFKARGLTFDNVIGLKNDSVSGKMYELIGQGVRRSDGRYRARNLNAGVRMRENMNKKHGNRKRVVWRIKEEHGVQIGGQMERIIDPILARFGKSR